MNSKNYIHRSIETYAFDDTLVGRHMVFIAGPRQVGKTRLARRWLDKTGCPSLYFNWDVPDTRRRYLIGANGLPTVCPQASRRWPDPAYCKNTPTGHG